MRDKYSQQQIHTEKLRVKIKATDILLHELKKMPEESATICETILFALKSHAEALQGHEHLLSGKGNTYALLEQTSGLRERHGDARASLLRYHDLKNRLLGPDTPLSADQEALIPILAENGVLNLQTLAALDKQAGTGKTGKPDYVYDNRSFLVQDSMSIALLKSIGCCICKSIMNQPREICLTGHSMCLACYKALREHDGINCPECRNTLLVRPNRNMQIERLINNLKVRCCNTDCRSIIEISEIKSHLNLCEEEKVECPGRCINEATGEVLRMPRKWLADHSKECSKYFRCDKTPPDQTYSEMTRSTISAQPRLQEATAVQGSRMENRAFASINSGRGLPKKEEIEMMLDMSEWSSVDVFQYFFSQDRVSGVLLLDL